MDAIHILDENLLLWNRFREGDTDAFAAIMRLHYSDLFHYGTRFTRDEEMVKDCIQDLFLLLWKNRQTISETSFVKYYLLKSLRRNLQKAIEKKRWPVPYKELPFEVELREDLSVEHLVIGRESRLELARRMRRVLEKLSKRQREVIYLRFYLEADIEEIAEIMSLSRQSVYNLQHDALKKLKQLSSQKAFSLTEMLHLLPVFLG